jgi:26S proteasome regulatory subunit N7
MPDSTTPSVDVSLPDEYMKIAQLRFSASQGKAGAAAELLKLIKKHDMAPFYVVVCEHLSWKRDGAQPHAGQQNQSLCYSLACRATHLAETLLSTMQAANVATLVQLDARIAESEKNDGETEIQEAVLARAVYQIRIGEKEVAYAGEGTRRAAIALQHMPSYASSQ